MLKVLLFPLLVGACAPAPGYKPSPPAPPPVAWPAPAFEPSTYRTYDDCADAAVKARAQVTDCNKWFPRRT